MRPRRSGSPGSSTTGLAKAIAHAVEGLYARDGNPLMDVIAEECIRAMTGALAAIARAPRDIEARSEALYAAWLGGVVLGGVGMALHHKLCHTLGGSFDLPHAQVHTVILPHAVAYNAPAIPAALARMGRALGTDRPAEAIQDLARSLNAPLAVANPYWNPQPIERGRIRELLRRAWAGERPE